MEGREVKERERERGSENEKSFGVCFCGSIGGALREHKTKLYTLEQPKGTFRNRLSRRWDSWPEATTNQQTVPAYRALSNSKEKNLAGKTLAATKNRNCFSSARKTREKASLSGSCFFKAESEAEEHESEKIVTWVCRWADVVLVVLCVSVPVSECVCVCVLCIQFSYELPAPNKIEQQNFVAIYVIELKKGPSLKRSVATLYKETRTPERAWKRERVRERVACVSVKSKRKELHKICNVKMPSAPRGPSLVSALRKCH